MCCHYNNHSGNICQMVCDCDIHQADGDDPDYPCMMVEQQPIDDIVTAAMLVVESQDIGAIGTARHSCLFHGTNEDEYNNMRCKVQQVEKEWRVWATYVNKS